MAECKYMGKQALKMGPGDKEMKVKMPSKKVEAQDKKDKPMESKMGKKVKMYGQ